MSVSQWGVTGFAVQAQFQPLAGGLLSLRCRGSVKLVMLDWTTGKILSRGRHDALPNLRSYNHLSPYHIRIIANMNAHMPTIYPSVG
jgi:hypothetical protein